MFKPTRFSARLAAILLLFPTAVPAEPFTVPLPEESIRDAYFLGQRRGGTAEEFLAQYQKNLSAPASGPWISSVKFLTPFAQVVSYSMQQMNYSAQQAVLDHRGQHETVAIEIVISLTSSYPATIVVPTGSRSGSPSGFKARPGDFWKDFRAQVSVQGKIVEPADFTGEPNSTCSEYDCVLSGATLHMTFAAKDLNADTVAVRILPPEGSVVVVEFAAGRMR